MKPTRRDFIKANAVATATAVAGISTPGAATNLVTDREQTELTWSKAPCRFCGTGCSVNVATRDNRVVATHGDINSPVNKGLSCVKGYFLSKIMYGTDRLQQPLLRKTGGKYDKKVSSSRSAGTRPSISWKKSSRKHSRKKGPRRWACLAQASGPCGKATPHPN